MSPSTIARSQATFGKNLRLSRVRIKSDKTIIMSPRKIFQAFALELSEQDDTPPKLSARGEYELAQHIVACARKYNVPIVERPELCSALETLEVDEQIPSELFEAAAMILAEVGALGSRSRTTID